MRIRPIASIAVCFSIAAFSACSQSGSPLSAAEEPLTSESSVAADSLGRAKVVAADESGESGASADSEGTAPGVEPSEENAPAVEPEGADADPEAAADATEPASDPETGSDSSPTAEPAVATADTGTAVTAPVDESPAVSDAGADNPAPSVVDAILAGNPSVPVDEPAVVQEPAAPTAAETAPAVTVPDPATVAAKAAPAAGMILNTDFESEDPACWNGNRAANGINAKGCGQFKSIGSAPYAMTDGGIARSGRKAIAITYVKNEQAGGANVSFSADSINMRAYYYFEPGFDFGQGIKIGRVSSFNTAKQINDIDIILEVRSAKSPSQCGVTDMNDVGVFFNGAPKGSDWGNVTSTMAFERGRWYAVEYQVVLNTPGRTDGVVRLWVDGKLVAERANLKISGGMGSEVKLNSAKIGGWYSNGANKNTCADPSQPAKLHMDDVAIATSYIGTVPALTAGR